MWRREDIEHPEPAEPAALPEPWLTKWRALDDEAEIARVHEELRVSLADWARAMAKLPGTRLAAVSFFYAGTEVAPWLPQDVWADGLAEVKREGEKLRRGARHFREYPAFALCVAGELLTELGEDDAFASSEIGEGLARGLVLRSLVWLHGGLKRLRADAAFAALPTTPDFVFLASPGHDEPWGVVG
jgi:hypothetical protein